LVNARLAYGYSVLLPIKAAKKLKDDCGLYSLEQNMLDDFIEIHSLKYILNKKAFNFLKAFCDPAGIMTYESKTY
jgi:hypothetical protein